MPGAFNTRRPHAGDPWKLPAEVAGAMLDVVREHKTGGLQPDLQERTAHDDLSVMLVKNTSNSALPAFSIVGLGDPIFDPDGGDAALAAFQETPGCKAAVPVSPDHVGRFAVLLEPLGVLEIGSAAVAGVVAVRVSVTDAAHGCADILDGDTVKLGSGSSGSARILWKPAGTGTKWAIVRIGSGGGQGIVVFPVGLTRDGGADGDQTTQASWTYTVYDFVGGLLKTTRGGDADATGIDPTASPHQLQRPAVGSMIEATSGLAYYASDGTLVLAYVNEMPDAEACAT